MYEKPLLEKHRVAQEGAATHSESRCAAQWARGPSAPRPLGGEGGESSQLVLITLSTIRVKWRRSDCILAQRQGASGCFNKEDIELKLREMYVQGKYSYNEHNTVLLNIFTQIFSLRAALFACS